ncbi:MAG: hypothetical protein LBM06_06955 [Prevotellaceae bacterium]|nr:hypothetical protein [Prevotellaceae bacterium]
MKPSVRKLPKCLLRIGIGLLICTTLLLLSSCVEEDWECPERSSLQEGIDVPAWDDDIHQQV